MNIIVRVETDKIGEQSFRSLIDKIHQVYTKHIFEEVKKKTPHDPFPHRSGQFEGEMMDYWNVQRSGFHTTDITNDSPHANILLGGSGIYGPVGRPICVRNAAMMVFPWRWKSYEIQARKCVQGVNPREIHGDPGHVYDLESDMKQAIEEGVDKAAAEMTE
jgi:hypothetical protein